MKDDAERQCRFPLRTYALASAVLNVGRDL